MDGGLHGARVVDKTIHITEKTVNAVIATQCLRTMRDYGNLHLPTLMMLRELRLFLEEAVDGTLTVLLIGVQVRMIERNTDTEPGQLLLYGDLGLRGQHLDLNQNQTGK